ncbi:MAG: GNAT family N-acetyltransferase [Clostridia bacterium]|nr:GNAT family N-acetyltransferase [Clostridia bacterium]
MKIKTERLTLHSFEDEDIETLCGILTNETIGKTYLLPEFKNDDAVFALAKRLQILSMRDDRYVWGIYQNKTLIGMLNDTDIQGENIEIGYALHPDYYNQGFATEVVKAVITYLFEKGFSTIYAGAFENNLASIRVMEKSGMKKMNSRASIDYRGKTYQCVYYSIKKEKKL